jgi:hypothetical protein
LRQTLLLAEHGQTLAQLMQICLLIRHHGFLRDGPIIEKVLARLFGLWEGVGGLGMKQGG